MLSINHLLPRRREIVEIIRDHRMVTFDFISRRFAPVPKSSLHFDLSQLIKKGHIIKLGITRGAVYDIVGDDLNDKMNQMKSFTKYISFHTKEKIEFINITNQVQDAIAESGIRDGICLINAMHITSSVFINDEEEGLKEDFKVWLEKLVPGDPSLYKHNLTGEDNAHSHIKRTVMGRETVVAVTGSRLDFGQWEQIFYGEFDGQRTKRVLVKIIGI